MDQPVPTQTPAPGAQSSPKKGVTASLIAVIAVAAIGTVYAFFSKKQAPVGPQPSSGAGALPPQNEPTPEAPLPSTLAPTPTPSVPVTQAPAQDEYKDGTYTAVGNYVSPGGPEEVGITLTLKDDTIVDTSFEMKAFRPKSIEMQTAFAENYKQFVVGKNIDEVNLSKVSSSSLTPKGFNDALEKIKQQATQS
ncbi:MAG: hypothetical protein WC659_00170 [Patescibacteria group bacterium]